MVNDLKDFLKERIKNPFLAALTFFWLVFNWKILAYILFSSDPIELKIESYKNYYNLYNFYLYPFVSATGYVILSTFVFAGIEWLSVSGFLLRRKIYYKKLKGDIESQKEVEYAKFQREEARSGYKAQKEINDKVDNLKEKITTIENENKKIELKANKLTDELEKYLVCIKNDIKNDERNEVIKDFIKNYTKNEIIEIGKKIHLVYIESADNEFSNEEFVINTKDNLIKNGFLLYESENDKKYSKISLSKKGMYALKIFNYSDINLNAYELSSIKFPKSSNKLIQ